MLFKRRDKREEFERAVKEVFPAIYSTALRFTRQEEDAQDLTQETLIKAYQAWDRFDGRNLKAWLLRIMTNTYINRVRKQKRGPESVSLEDSVEAMNLPSQEAPPLEQILERVVDNSLEEAIQSLPDEYRAAIVLSDVEGLSYREVADALGVPVGTVRSRLARGRAMLREKLLDYAKEHGIV
ncbi:MAG: ECF RNA polymerase sigma factor SigR [Fimbriimonadales bacterium]|nr:MAG: ECF RNA polymerase sigma factor SigR [Fimbriimonadales bacterium]